MLALHEALRLGDIPPPNRIARITAATDGPLAPAVANYARARTAADATVLTQVAETFAQLGLIRAGGA